MATFKAIVIEKAEGGTKAALTQFDETALMDGEVTVRPRGRHQFVCVVPTCWR